MTENPLVRMANDIARNLQAAHSDDAASATAEHLRNFWAPSMRRALIAHADAGGDGLSVVALGAAALLRADQTKQTSVIP